MLSDQVRPPPSEISLLPEMISLLRVRRPTVGSEAVSVEALEPSDILSQTDFFTGATELSAFWPCQGVVQNESSVVPVHINDGDSVRKGSCGSGRDRDSVSGGTRKVELTNKRGTFVSR